MAKATGSGRVWVVGAGASASFGAPTTDRLLDECLRQDTHFRHRELLPKVLDYLYPSVRKRGNIEEFMSLLDTWIQMNDIRNGPLIPTNSLVQVRTLLLKLMKQVLNQSLNALKSTSPFAKWVRMLHPGDTVISFNWDVAIEHCIQEFDKKSLPLRYLPSGPHNALTLLKPHGSVNWYEMPSEGYEAVDDAHPFRKDWRRCAYADCRETLKFPSKSYGRRAPVMVPPVNAKVFWSETSNESQRSFEKQRDDLFKEIWRGAYNALRNAAEIYILGYSLPPLDWHARWVFRAALRSNLIRTRKGRAQHAKLKVRVVNPKQEATTRFRDLLGRDQSLDFDSQILKLENADLIGITRKV